MEDFDEKLLSRFNDKVSYKIDFTANGIHTDHSPSWEYYSL